MKIKREPLLVDKFLAMDYKSDPTAITTEKFYNTTKANLRIAKRFVLDQDAARYCAELLRDNPRIIADAQDFAIPPFDITYIEIPHTIWYETITGKKSDLTADTQTGYLIAHNSVRGIAGRDNFAGLSGIEYHLNKPWSLEQQVAAAQEYGISRLGFDMFFWGSSIVKLSDKSDFICNPDGSHSINTEGSIWDKEGVRSLRENHSFELNLRAGINKQQFWGQLYNGSAGDLRNIIGLLLFLNRTSEVRYERAEPTLPGRFIGRKQTNFLAHRVISFKLNPLPRLVKLCAGESIRRRLHDVRGHFCHNKIARENNHLHDWIEAAENHLQWSCECGGLRWWRNPHMRGHEGKGLVLSEYNVKE